MRSQKILDDMAIRIKTYAGVQLSFSATVTQLQDKSESTHAGKIWLKDDKYKMELSDQTLYFNGVKLYQYLPEVKEVNVTQSDMSEDDDDLQLFNPKALFRLSSKNFRSNFVREGMENHRKIFEIDLYPVQVKTTRYSRIRLCIEQETLQMAHLKAFMKDGTQYAIDFAPYVMERDLPDSFFEFPASAHPDVEINDLTF
jgi:outer membrane lipoprotein-sorting protein